MSYNAHAQLLFRSLNLLFSNVPVAVVAVVFLNSLLCLHAGTSSISTGNQSFEFNARAMIVSKDTRTHPVAATAAIVRFPYMVQQQT